MRRAIDVAVPPHPSAAEAEDVPVGAVVFAPDGTELAHARNERERTGDPTAHAEILALRRAASAVGELATRRLHARRDARAVHDVCGRARAGPGLDARLRCLGAQDGRRRVAVGRRTGPTAQPPPRGVRRRARRAKARR